MKIPSFFCFLCVFLFAAPSVHAAETGRSPSLREGAEVVGRDAWARLHGFLLSRGLIEETPDGPKDATASERPVELTVELQFRPRPTQALQPMPAPVSTPDPRRKAIILTGITLTSALAAAGTGTLIAWKLQPGAKVGTPCNYTCTWLKNDTFWTFLGAGGVGGSTLIYALSSRSPLKKEPLVTVLAGPKAADLLFTWAW